MLRREPRIHKHYLKALQIHKDIGWHIDLQKSENSWENIQDSQNQKAHHKLSKHHDKYDKLHLNCKSDQYTPQYTCCQATQN